MTRFAAPLFVLVSLYAGAVSASSVAAPASCDGFLKRACTKQEQTYFDKAAKTPVASKHAQGARDCDSFLKRTCSKQEKAHFAKSTKPLNVRPANFASSCDSFLKRACSKQEKLSFAKGTQTHLTLASK